MKPGKSDGHSKYIFFKYILWLMFRVFPWKFIDMSLFFIDEKSALVQVMAWGHQTSTQCLHLWSTSIVPYGITCPQLVNSSLSGQHGRHFADVFKCIFLNKKLCILVQISLKFVPKGLIDNKSVLVQEMAWCRTGDNPLPEPMLT